MFNGMEGPVQEMYLFRLFADALLWCKVLRQLPGVDAQRLAVYGEGAGGALAIVCAAMAPGFVKCAAHYPLLCHYARVWELDFDTGPYEGLRYYFRWHDPLHQRRQEIFERLAYVDAVNFAPYVHCPVLLSTGLQDTVSPPSAQFALANALQAPLQHKVYPKHGHELNNFFENEWLRFLLTEAMQPVC
jgi:cephalosporin-C deacetylase